MKPPVALFKKKNTKLNLFLKAKSQTKAYQHSCMLLAWEERRKEKCSEENRWELLRISLFYFLGLWVIRPPAFIFGPRPRKSFNQLNLPLGKVIHYDHAHITFNGLRVI